MNARAAIALAAVGVRRLDFDGERCVGLRMRARRTLLPSVKTAA